MYPGHLSLADSAAVHGGNNHISNNTMTSRNIKQQTDGCIAAEVLCNDLIHTTQWAKGGFTHRWLPYTIGREMFYTT